MIKDELIGTAKQLDIDLELLDEKTFNAVWELIKMRFIDSNSCGVFLWERLKDYIGLTDPMGWSYIGDLVGDKPCIIMYYENDSFHMVRIDNGTELTNLLGECYSFEFYVLDEQASYVICFTHHDQLICVGEAKKWLAKIFPNIKKGRKRPNDKTFR